MTPADLFAVGLLAFSVFKDRIFKPAPGPTIMPAPAPTPPTVTVKPPPALLPKPALPAPTQVPWPTAEAIPAFQPLSRTSPAVIKTTTAEPHTEAAAMESRIRDPLNPTYWMYAQKVTPAERDYAAARLRQFVKDGASGTQIWFTGPKTFTGSRQFRTAKHGGKTAVEIFQPKPPFVHQPGAAKAAPAPARAPAGKPTLRQGARGAPVAEVQTKLGLKADGIFGPQTKAAVVAFQKSRGLTPDGIVGAQTWAALG